ncbi:hypothetical protein VB712_08315 [Spirulina sp. CCNP1310]|uniref:hypothetical protein n=1 Tax=Spirulina sp. CCNP1310 TaxID=3110249 RepID=UPI002B1EFDDD|nr:hypothetical protein [Spirulina sp. CCNP1310]MEA5419231.1 hypothetical protein [Spirulina sp. CCNP1310]
MLSFNFYGKSNQKAHSIQFSEDFYQWLIESDFGWVGRSRLMKIMIDGEWEELPVITLENPTRAMLVTYLNEMVLRETGNFLQDLDENLPRERLEPRHYRMKKLLELLSCMKDVDWMYFQRV